MRRDGRDDAPAAATDAEDIDPSRRLRIALVYDALYPYRAGGAERRYHEIAVRLAMRHEVHLVGWRFWTGTAPRSPGGPVLHGLGPAPAFYGRDGRRTIREAAAFAARLVPHLLRERYDVIDCSATPYVPVYACALAARLSGTPLVVTWHEYWGDYWRTYLADRPVVARLARAAEAHCRGLGQIAVAVSPFTATLLMHDGAGPSPAVVPNGVPIAEIDAAPPAAGRIDVLFVGRLIADKKIDDLLAAVARLRQDRPHLRCAIIGEGPELGRLEAMAVDLGLQGVVSFFGRLEGVDVFAAMKAADVLVLPSLREGYGISVVEAMAAGAVPVVVRGPQSAASALIEDGRTGVVSDPGPSALAAAIGRLLDDPAGRSRMREAARASALEHDWDRTAIGLERLYRSVTRGSRQSATGAASIHADA
ncbi:MAG: glycosyltransferase family 4 protein [Candidatus Limnocylindrales bacterium]